MLSPWGWIKTNPIAKAKFVPAPETEPIYLKKPEIAEFIASIKDLDARRMGAVAYIATGRRRAELVAMKKTDVDLEDGRYKVIAKGGKTQWYHINDLFRAVLEVCMQRESSSSQDGDIRTR